MRRALFLAAVAAVLGHAALAGAGEIAVREPWARASAGANGAAYMTLANTGSEPDRLVAASSPAAKTAELHTHMHEGEIMRMRPVDGIDLPPGATETMAPGGLHVMLLGLKHPLREGDSVPLTLRFRDAGDITVEVPVRGIAAMGPHHKAH